MEYPKRKHPRLKDYDYSQNGAYYITICVKCHECILGEIGSDKTVRLSEYGRTVERFIRQIDAHYPFVRVVNYIVMPNHVHLLIQKDVPPTLLSADRTAVKTADIETIRHALKRMTTKEIGRSIWQDSFYDHVVRNHPDIQRISDYIDANPRRWRTGDG